METQSYTVQGFYGVMDKVPKSKLDAYARFMRSRDGLLWRDDVRFEKAQWLRNLRQLNGAG